MFCDKYQWTAFPKAFKVISVGRKSTLSFILCTNFFVHLHLSRYHLAKYWPFLELKRICDPDALVKVMESIVSSLPGLIILWETLYPLPGYPWSEAREELQKICQMLRFHEKLNGRLEFILALHVLYIWFSMKEGKVLFVTPHCQTSWLVTLQTFHIFWFWREKCSVFSIILVLLFSTSYWCYSCY